MTRFGGYTDTRAERILKELKEKSKKKLDDLFSRGKLPTFKNFKGETKGSFLLWSDKNTSWFTLFVIKLFFESPIARWIGKEFIYEFAENKKGFGINLFDNKIFPKRFKFDTYFKKAYTDNKLCLALDYRNYKSLMFGLVDDVRKINKGVLLGRMYYKFPLGKRKFIGYFSLCALK